MRTIPKVNPRNPTIIPAADFSSTNQPAGRGRPKGSLSLTTRLRNYLSKGYDAQARALIIATVKHAKKGNAAALKTVWDRVDGVLVEKVEIDHGLKGLSDTELEVMIADLIGKSKS